MTKLTAEFQVAKKDVDARLARVDRERADDAKLVESEALQVSQKIALQEQQVTLNTSPLTQATFVLGAVRAL